MTDWTLRPATPGDADALRACIAAAYAPFRASIPDLPDVTEGLEADIARHLVIVAITPDGRLGGGMVAHLEADHLKLANVAVGPDARGQGLGGRLIEAAVAAARAHALAQVRLTTHAAMADNIALYRHLGWQITGTDRQKIHMSRILDAPGRN